MDRRSFLRGAALAGAAPVAGCSRGGTGQQGYGDWFDDVANFDGPVDRTGRGEVRVLVGAEGNGGPFAFDPAAVRVSTGTTVVWEWTGRGGEHNVVAEDGSFHSRFASAEGHTYSRAFRRPGTDRYYCKPHLSLGMKGAVDVVEG